MCVDLLFVVDLMGRFLTAYFDDTAGRLVFQPVSILRHYASGLLVPDLIASVPLTVVSPPPLMASVPVVWRFILDGGVSQGRSSQMLGIGC